MNLKNPEAERLVDEVRRVTGETRTQAVIRALEERLVRLQGRRRSPDLADTLRDIARRCRALPDVDTRTPDEILGYDDDGTFFLAADRPWSSTRRR